MTRTVTRRPLTPIGLVRPRHGQKRKGRSVEAWKKDLQQDENSEDVRIPGVHLNAIEQIANGVERMMFSWNLDTFERGQEQAKIFSVAAPIAMNPNPTGDDEPVYRSDPKADSGKASTASHKFSPPQVTTDVPSPVRLTHEKNISCSILETRAAFEAPGNSSGVTVRHDKMSVGTVTKERREIAACEKSVGTEARDHQEPESTNKVAMTGFSPGLSFRGLTPSPDAPTLPHHERTCYPVKENSCSYQSPGFSVAERQQLQVSPRKEEPLSCHASTHSFSNFCHSRDPSIERHSETDAGLDKATYIDVVATHSAKAHNFNNHGPNSGALSHSSSYYWPCRTGTIETLEVGGRPVTMPALRNGTEALRNKFESLIHRTSGAPLIQGKERPCSAPPEISSVEELQLALIECATEYEIQTLDARIKMHGMGAQKRQITSCEFDQPANSHENQNHVSEMISTPGGAKILPSQYALQRVRRDVMKPEQLKATTIKPDPQPWKKKERLGPELKKSENGIRAFSRLFDRQRRSLDDALNHVDRLQREVVRKDRELVEWQLKEKEMRTQMHELEDKVKKTRVLQASSRLEPRKLFVALPALRESLRSFKALQEEQKQIRSPLTEAAQELSNLENQSMREMSDRDCSLNTRLQCLEERASEMDELKVTMSKLASNMGELSMAFKDHVQFVNHRLGAIHGHVMKRKIPVTSHSSPELVPSYVSNRNAVGQLKLAAVKTLEAEREITRSPTP